MKKYFLALLSLIIIIPVKTLAVCPVCTIAVAGGLGLSRWLGIDDTIAGVWVGGLTVSLIAWTIDWLKRKHWTWRGHKIVITVGYYLLIIWPLYYYQIIGHPYNQLLGIDKLTLGVITGSIIFLITALFYNYLKKRNNDHAYFPYQKVVMPVSAMIILSFIFYFITK